MSTIKRIIHFFSSGLMFALLLVFLLLSPIAARLAEPDGVTGWLEASNTYENVYDNLPELIQFINDNAQEEGENPEPIELNPEFISVLRSAVPPQDLTDIIQSGANNLYQQLDSTAGTLYLRADLREVRDSLVAATDNEFVAYLEGLPTCEDNQTVNINSDDFNPFAIECLPENFADISQVTSDIKEFLQDNEDGLGEVLASIEEPIENSQDLRSIYNYLRFLDLYSLIAIGFLFLVAIFTARNWREGARGQAWLFIAVGLPIFIGAFIFSQVNIVEMVPAFDDTTTLTAAEQAVSENIIRPLADTVVSSLMGRTMLISGLFVAVGVSILMITAYLQRDMRFKHPPEPKHSKHPGAHKQPAEKLDEGEHVVTLPDAKENIVKKK